MLVFSDAIAIFFSHRQCNSQFEVWLLKYPLKCAHAIQVPYNAIYKCRARITRGIFHYFDVLLMLLINMTYMGITHLNESCFG